MANQVALEATAGSSSPPSLNESNVSSASSTCDGEATLANPLCPTSRPCDPRSGTNADGDSSGESSYTNLSLPVSGNDSESRTNKKCQHLSLERESTGREFKSKCSITTVIGAPVIPVKGDGGNSCLPRLPLVRKESDCPEIFRTSVMAIGRRGNLCSLHQSGVRKVRASVGCQTDSDEDTFPKMPICRNSIGQTPTIKGTVPSSSNTDASSSAPSDGILRLIIQNFKNMSDTVRGPSKKIQSVPWRIMVMPRQHVVQKKGTQKCLGFFLQCCPDAYSDSWSCQASAELRLISQKQGVPHFTRKTNHVYTAKENDWGYSCFMTWADIMDESQGYIKDDKVILEVSVKAEPPKNILTHEQFEKKIQDYMRLADIQSSRGLIDKAIEVNTSAIKFCKDRDQECKTELEAQKAKLIEMKLKQSIERIEKGPPQGKSDEENSLNQNALKQAIAGAAPISKQSGIGKSTSKGIGGKIRDNTSDKKENVQRTQTPPLSEKSTDKTVSEENETQLSVQNDKGIPLPPETPTDLLTNYKTPWYNETRHSDEDFEDLRSEAKCVRHLDGTVCSDVMDGKTDSLERMVDKDGALQLLQKNGLTDGLTPFAKTALELDNIASQVGENRQAWTAISGGNMNDQHVECISDEETSSSGGASSDSEGDTNAGRTAVGVPLSKKMKRSLENALLGPDECDSCIQAMLEPASLSAEASCQTDFTMLTEIPKSNDAAVVTAHTAVSNVNPSRHYAQPKKQSARKILGNGSTAVTKFDDTDWRKKKTSELKEVETARKKHEEVQPFVESIADKVSTDSDTSSKDTSTTFNHYLAADPKLQPLPGVFPVYQTQQIFGEDLHGPQFQTLLDDSAQHNIWTRQYIEEWLKFNIKYCWKYMRNGENSPAPVDESCMDYGAGNIPHFTDAQVQQVMAALSVIGVNCVNAKRVVDKAAEFINALETRSRSPVLKSCLQKLAYLAGEERDVCKESRKGTGDVHSNGKRSLKLDCTAVDEQHLPALHDDTELPSVLSDDQHDYMLNREVHRIGVFADQAAGKNPLMEVDHVEKLEQHIAKIEQRIMTLETDKDALAKQLSTEKEKIKKLEQKHANVLKTMQTQLQNEKEKHDKLMQQFNQKKNELKKQEKLIKQHERDLERTRDIQEKVESSQRELQEVKQKHQEDTRRFQRDLQSSHDTRKNLVEELEGRKNEISELKNQLNEKTLALKRAENASNSERKTLQSGYTTANERAKKAEIALLELQLETGLSVLERAHRDAGQRCAHVDSELKKRGGTVFDDHKKLASEWVKLREDITNLIVTTKEQFAKQVEQIRNGKTLAQLPKLSVPKPPPPPKLKTTPVSAVGSEKAAAVSSSVNAPASVGVIGSRSPAQNAGVLDQFFKTPEKRETFVKGPLISTTVSSGSTMQALSKAPAPPATASSVKSPTTTTSITPIGVRPSNHAGAGLDFANSHSMASSTTASASQPTQVSTANNTASGSGLTPTPWSSGWDPINELMNPARQMGPFVTEYGIGSTNASSQFSLSHPPPGLANPNHFGTAQSNGWSNGSTSDWMSLSHQTSAASNTNTLLSGQPGHFGHIQQQQNSQQSQQQQQQQQGNGAYHSQWTTGWSSYQTSPQPNAPSDVAMWNKGNTPTMAAMMQQPPPNVMPNSVGVVLPPVEQYQTQTARLHPQHSNVHPHILPQQLRDGMDS